VLQRNESLPVTASWEEDTQMENIKEGTEARTGLGPQTCQEEEEEEES
jgi:hypothetical protein